MLKGLIRQIDVAVSLGVTLALVRQQAMRRDFPPVKLKIGLVKFYDVKAMDRFWRNRVDGRTREGKRRAARH